MQNVTCNKNANNSNVKRHHLPNRITKHFKTILLPTCGRPAAMRTKSWSRQKKKRKKAKTSNHLADIWDFSSAAACFDRKSLTFLFFLLWCFLLFLFYLSVFVVAICSYYSKILLLPLHFHLVFFFFQQTNIAFVVVMSRKSCKIMDSYSIKYHIRSLWLLRYEVWISITA